MRAMSHCVRIFKLSSCSLQVCCPSASTKCMQCVLSDPLALLSSWYIASLHSCRHGHRAFFQQKHQELFGPQGLLAHQVSWRRSGAGFTPHAAQCSPVNTPARCSSRRNAKWPGRMAEARLATRSCACQSVWLLPHLLQSTQHHAPFHPTSCLLMPTEQAALFPASTFTLHNFTWGVATVRARAHAPLEGAALSLVPLADEVQFLYALSSFKYFDSGGCSFVRFVHVVPGGLSAIRVLRLMVHVHFEVCMIVTEGRRQCAEDLWPTDSPSCSQIYHARDDPGSTVCCCVTRPAAVPPPGSQHGVEGQVGRFPVTRTAADGGGDTRHPQGDTQYSRAAQCNEWRYITVQCSAVRLCSTAHRHAAHTTCTHSAVGHGCSHVLVI